MLLSRTVHKFLVIFFLLNYRQEQESLMPFFNVAAFMIKFILKRF